MADNTIVMQGAFTSNGSPHTLILRSDVDWMMTWNLTEIATTNQWASVKHYWQRELPFGDHIVDYHAANSQAVSTTTGIVGINGVTNLPGFYPIDSSLPQTGTPIAVTAGTNATQPVYSTANTGVLRAGAIVRLYGTQHSTINGLDFSVDTVVAGNSFRLANTIATAPGVAAGGNGFWRYVAPDLATYKLFYPSNRVIANITQAANGVVTTLVDHGYASGQRLRMKVPATNGMVELDNREVTITVLSASTFSIDVNTVGMTAFRFPLPAIAPCTPAEVVPVGTAPSLVTNLTGATQNIGYIGMVLGAGAGCPAGQNGDVIKWLCGKSFNV